MFFHILPPIHARETKQEKKPKKHRTGGRPKYDHFQMFKDKCNGLTWAEIAEKHSISGGADGAHNILLNSSLLRRLTPQEIAKMRGLRTH